MKSSDFSLSRLPVRDPAELGEHPCIKCGVTAKYIHKHTHWCRTCLDIEQYPNLAHLSQDEREQLRVDASKGVSKRGVINGGNFQQERKEQKVEFGV